MQRLVKTQFVSSNFGDFPQNYSSNNNIWFLDSRWDSDLSFRVRSKRSNINWRPFFMFNKQIYVSQRLAGSFASIDWVYWCIFQFSVNKIDTQIREYPIAQSKHCIECQLDKIGLILHSSCKNLCHRDHSSVCIEVKCHFIVNHK